MLFRQAAQKISLKEVHGALCCMRKPFKWMLCWVRLLDVKCQKIILQKMIMPGLKNINIAWTWEILQQRFDRLHAVHVKVVIKTNNVLQQLTVRCEIQNAYTSTYKLKVTIPTARPQIYIITPFFKKTYLHTIRLPVVYWNAFFIWALQQL